ncbi:YhgN family NAAT transporter [Buchnera aphidicola (Kurisakia onigurumii)]|uniref:YhgN family NAAT transporter n=1 Tax=Buchnera aphidicola TaxID=9 RepID=UPI0031B693A9
MHEIISNSILLILIMDPLGNLPLFMSLLKNFSPKKQRLILIREMLFSLIIMIIFLFSGEKILHSLNVKTETVSISGGIILFLIAIKMIFPIEYNDKMFIKEKNIEEPFLVPLAIPLVAGPSLLATLMLLSHQYSKNIICLIISLIISWLFTLIILLLSGLFLKILGKKGVNVLEKLMGLILIMLSIQMFLNGIKIWFHS